MLHVALLATVVTACAGQEPAGPTAADRKIYEAVRIKAGQDPTALVKLSLWCEAHGLTAERGKHLMAAIGVEPSNVAARGLLGLISYRGKWLSPEDVRVERKSDQELAKKLEAYYPRRAALEVSIRTKKLGTGGLRRLALAHEKLGVWCEEQGLKDEAIAHFSTAVQFDPYLDAPWRHLGYAKHHGRWMTRDQIVADERAAAAQRTADRHWDALLRKWKADLGEKKRWKAADESLANVTDPRAVPAIARVFANGPPADQLRAVSMLARIDGQAASMELARLAIFRETKHVRERATAALTLREPRDYVGPLIEMVQIPVTYKYQSVQGAGSQGGLLIDTPRFTMLRTYDAPAAFTLAGSFRGAVTYDASGMPMVYRGVDLDAIKFGSARNALEITREVKTRTEMFIIEANLKAAAAQQQLIADVGAIEQFNSQTAAVNEVLLPVLQEAAGAPASKTDQDGLYTWWYDSLGYCYAPPQKIEVAVNAFPQIPPPSLTTCFAAGTPVRTMEGLRPIEQIRPGDLVLSQDVATGGLDFRPIVVVHHNAPNQTLRITLSDDEILVASVYHRFWVSGKGWSQARDLKPADVLRTLGSTVRVVSIEEGLREPLYNLDVAKNRTFFAGSGGVLVHDNTLPPTRQTMFDAPPNLEAALQGAE
jgi:Pretoxin HINT domain